MQVTQYVDTALELPIHEQVDQYIDITLELPIHSQTTQYIDTALTHRHELTVVEFVKLVNYPIDTFMLTRFWDTLGDRKLPIYVDDDLIKRFGYSNVDAAGRKRAFVSLLSSFREGSDYLKYTNEGYATFRKLICAGPHMTSYPDVDKSHGKNPTIHYFLYFYR